MTTYTNITLFGTTQDELVTYCEVSAITAYISPTLDDITVIYPPLVGEPLWQLAEAVSLRLNCSALAVAVADDAQLVYRLYVGGRMTDEYSSRYGQTPLGGNPQVLAEAFDAAEEVDAVRAALLRDTLLASERHYEIADALILPLMMVDIGFEYLEDGEKPRGVDDHDDVVFVGEMAFDDSTPLDDYPDDEEPV
ncbi:MAG: hypothetical protein ACOYL5_07775 [Phototrophicaceae bacterium]|jgi:hypothetical protein